MMKLSWWFMGLLALFKILAASIMIGSGGSGGIFTPSLFMGAMAGGAFYFETGATKSLLQKLSENCTLFGCVGALFRIFQ